MLRPLAEALVTLADLQPDDSVIDLGTGTGVAAEAASQVCRRVFGVDFASQMIAHASQSEAVNFAQADIHRLPFPSRQFDAALAAFAFNSADPEAAFSEVVRVVKPSGSLTLFEWGLVDEISDYISEVVALYSVDEAPPALADFREQQQQPMPWDQIETLDDLSTSAEKANLEIMVADVKAISITLASLETFIQYKFTWPSRSAEFEAMPTEMQALCMTEIYENLTPHTNRDGSFTWEPNVIRMTAKRI